MAEPPISGVRHTANACNTVITSYSIHYTKLYDAQDNQINQNQSEIINKIDRNISLLSKLNRNLLLLAKIENKQFNKTETIVVSEVMNEVYEAFDEHIKLMGIHFSSFVSENKSIDSNPQLVHSLLFNLMTNARNNFV